jgi:hypothetical protein
MEGNRILLGPIIQTSPLRNSHLVLVDGNGQLPSGSSRQSSIGNPAALFNRLRIRVAKTQALARNEGSTIPGQANTQYRMLPLNRGVNTTCGSASSEKVIALFLYSSNIKGQNLWTVPFMTMPPKFVEVNQFFVIVARVRSENLE